MIPSIEQFIICWIKRYESKTLDRQNNFDPVMSRKTVTKVSRYKVMFLGIQVLPEENTYTDTRVYGVKVILFLILFF